MQTLARMIDTKMGRWQQEDYIWALYVVMGDDFYERWDEKLKIARAIVRNRLDLYLVRKGHGEQAALWREYCEWRERKPHV